mmetsp:Transcript_30237/g.48835  ORF Transcript_30237/g.48835 Transcript_30237/m.48835 type:complete len:263 (+) Transcript_30237:828-1616(+)
MTCIETTDPGNKLSVSAVEDTITRLGVLRPHSIQPGALSISNLTERGAAYSVEQLSALSECCKKHGLGFHVDGARFVNALAYLGVSPAELSWKAGVDILTLGGTKNGAMLAEMIVVLNPFYATDMDIYLKRGGQLMSKTRYIAAQFLAYFEKDLWLRNAAHANNMARALVSAVNSMNPLVRVRHKVQGNEVFVLMDAELADHLWARGVYFYEWEEKGEYRLVTSFATSEHEIGAFVSAVNEFRSMNSLVNSIASSTVSNEDL